LLQHRCVGGKAVEAWNDETARGHDLLLKRDEESFLGGKEKKAATCMGGRVRSKEKRPSEKKGVG